MSLKVCLLWKKTPRIMFNTYLAVSFLAVSWRGKLVIDKYLHIQYLFWCWCANRICWTLFGIQQKSVEVCEIPSLLGISNQLLEHEHHTIAACHKLKPGARSLPNHGGETFNFGYPPWNKHFALENKPPQKDIYLPTIGFQGQISC